MELNVTQEQADLAAQLENEEVQKVLNQHLNNRIVVLRAKVIELQETVDGLRAELNAAQESPADKTPSPEPVVEALIDTGVSDSQVAAQHN